MPRGGRRLGAGRKPDIPPEDAKLIREDCEQRSRAQRRKQWEASIKRELVKRGGVIWEEGGKPNPADLREVFNRLRKRSGMPPVTTAEVARYQSIVSEYGLQKPEKKIPESLPEKVKNAIDRVRENKKKKTRRHFSTQTLPGLYGRQRQKIIADVARSWGVTPRAVRSIWEAEPDV
jgi:hypothetical protein